MVTIVRPAIVLTLAFTLLTGVAYPLAVTGIGQLAFPNAANGSRVETGSTVVGSALIGQNFTQAKYFSPRPSATAEVPYNAGASGGSNYGPTDKRLIERVKTGVAALRETRAAADAATTSGSGLDPDISPANAQSQVARVAAARGLDPQKLAALVTRMTAEPVLGIFGEPRVNVLALNMALDAEAPQAN